MELEKALNVQVANWSLLYTKLHRFHWFVKGPSFFTLHAKFEELYEEAATVVDEVAERLLAIGGTPVATMKEYLEIATLNENDGETKAQDMINTLVNDYKAIKEQLIEIIKLTEEKNDIVTNDLAVGLVEKIDTHLWMLSAYMAD